MLSNASPALREAVRFLPRLLVVVAVVAGSAFAVSRVNAAGEAPFANAILTGGQLTKPSGVGFVLAVTIQRNQ